MQLTRPMPSIPVMVLRQRPPSAHPNPMSSRCWKKWPRCTRHCLARCSCRSIGIFQDLQEAHPDVFERDSLKAALSLHTRSTRYLTAVASGEDRHDLQGKPVEAMAPEHVHHALLEVFRRRQTRIKEDLRPKLIQRIVVAWEASGLSPQAYAELVRSRDEAANAALDEAMVDAEARAAKTEALLQAFKASGKSLEVFADMYGMDPRAVTRMLARATVTPPTPSTPQD